MGRDEEEEEEAREEEEEEEEEEREEEEGVNHFVAEGVCRWHDHVRPAHL